ncbi:MAG: translation initiation factor IF-5A [Candidatus Pacearchaeota archaeon]|nr:translation initiation factor IF-5A [Candidatus Pacearchaeota archaeon]
MAFKLIDAAEAKSGTAIIVEGAPCIVRSQEISKTGKHGHAKARIEAIGIIDGKKRVVVVPGMDRLEVPLIKKAKAQILSVNEGKASIMDLETFETLDVNVDPEVQDLKEGDNAEYWDVEGFKVIKRKA